MANEPASSSNRLPQVRGQKLTDRVLAAARDALARHGYPNLNMDLLADELGIAKTSIYRRWPTKAELIAETADFADLPTGNPPDTGNLHDDLLHLLNQSFTAVTSRNNFYQALIRAAAAHPELAEPVQRQTHRRRNEYQLVINRAIARGELPPNTDTDTIFDHLYGPIWFRILITGRNPNELEPHHLVTTTLNGVGWKPPS